MIRGIANLLSKVGRTGLYSDLIDCPSVPSVVQRTRAQTNTSGAYTWTFPQAYGIGVIPIIQVTVEDGGAGIFDHKIVSVNNTVVTIQISKTLVATLLGIDVLQVQSNPQAWLHISAMTP